MCELFLSRITGTDTLKRKSVTDFVVWLINLIILQDNDLEDCYLSTPVNPVNIEACHHLKLKVKPKKVII